MNVNAVFCRDCIAALSNGEFYFSLSIGIAASLFCLFRCYWNFHLKRLIEDMPTSKIRSASQGFSELIGRAKHIAQPQTAPLTGEPCVWWRYRIERYQRSQKSGFWRTVERRTSRHPFYLDDGTGHCLIDPEGAEIDSRHRKTWYGNSSRPILKPIHFDGRRVVMTPMLSNIGIGKRYRYTEEQIRDGDPLYALGHFSTDTRGERCFSVQALRSDILREWKLDFQTLLDKFDSNNDGELDIHEWQQVTQVAHKLAEEERTNLLALPDEHMLSKPNTNGLPFIIGSQSQDQLISRLFRKALLFSTGFLFTGAFCAWLLSARFNF